VAVFLSPGSEEGCGAALRLMLCVPGWPASCAGGDNSFLASNSKVKEEVNTEVSRFAADADLSGGGKPATSCRDKGSLLRTVSR